MLYSAWITGQFTTPDVDRTQGYVSELAAVDQPWARLFRAGDVLSGLACLAGVALTPHVRGEWPGWLALGGFGLLLAAGGAFPLDCAPISDEECGTAGLSPAHRVHELAGVLGTAAVLAAMVLLAVRWRSWVAWLFTGLTLAATAVLLVAVAAGQWAGIAHRVLMTLIAVWLVYVALRLLITDGHTVRSGPPHVVRQGDGPAVLLTSGPAGAWFHWDAVAAELAARHRVTRFDRPGLGLSPPSPEPPTLYGEAARLAALAPAHPQRVTVVAHELSCWHAEAFARLHPLCVAKLVLVDPACASGGKRPQVRRALGRWTPALGATWGATALARVAGPAAHRLLTGAGDPAGVYRRGSVLAAAAGEWLARRDMAADLCAIRAEHPFPDVPVTVISSGEDDPCTERLAETLNATLVRLPATERPIPLDDPGAVAAAV
ncbi:alpha/beta fold hydrolase [Nonomuraea sp. NN258]|uniref:alpha/beta fold hydrolase n=1 Tax=Nonomuraea antri TaxID=2730852 RepID=UPI0015695177|nr:alpha/beta fold hydrolase [Nonomuraea antri]NRQ38895.1 alpha/beta fold hydrolase [Nonomuraea antri]